MKKNFKGWSRIKELINDDGASKSDFKERDIWWTYYGANVGFEQDGKGEKFMRPVLIFKKFSRNICWIIPLSTQVSIGSHFFPLLSESNIIRMAALHQVRLFDVKRLINKIECISEKEHTFVKEKVIALIRRPFQTSSG